MTTAKEMTDLIMKGLTDRVRQELEQWPELAKGKTDQGLSFLLLAAYCRNKDIIALIRKGKPEIDFHEASAIGDLATVTRLSQTDPEWINSYSVDGFTPLGYACFFGHPEMAGYLIQNGADVNKPANNSFKVAPIHSACAISHAGLIELLLQHGVDVNATQQGGITPLHETAHNGQTKLSELLLTHGADVNAKSGDGKTPLTMAEEKSFSETADLIRKHGGK